MNVLVMGLILLAPLVVAMDHMRDHMHNRSGLYKLESIVKTSATNHTPGNINILWEHIATGFPGSLGAAYINHTKSIRNGRRSCGMKGRKNNTHISRQLRLYSIQLPGPGKPTVQINGKIVPTDRKRTSKMSSLNQLGAQRKKQAERHIKQCAEETLGALDAAVSEVCPKREARECVVELRLGDAMCSDMIGHRNHSIPPPSVKIVMQTVLGLKRDGRCLFIYNTQGGCINETEAYISSIKAYYEANVQRDAAKFEIEPSIGWRGVDRHFCEMVHSSLFFAGAGGLSYIAERLRAFRGSKSIRTLIPYFATKLSWLETNEQVEKRNAHDQFILEMMERTGHEKRNVRAAYISEMFQRTGVGSNKRKPSGVGSFLMMNNITDT